MKNRIIFQDLVMKNKASNQKFQPKYCCKYSEEAMTTMLGKIGMN